ncbi:MAG: hypothetical protein F6K53_11900 [Moorea sp. SIO4A1]|uniref:hypothetical protein n=1 Tax=Moorena sp. SIO4A1 TaxID=2607835 RepID=UPI00144D7E11|nr:hypothetical protein [Moorena sp. SIO4A1]NEQ58071.1 hypothetical protein [Moorena sp. SIO4A1]
MWNGHLGGTGILVELASCQFQYIPGGQNAHPTHIYPKIQQCRESQKPKAKRVLSDAFPTPYSLLPTPCAIDSMKKIPSQENYGNRDAR